jgi:hypothetical protein
MRDEVKLRDGHLLLLEVLRIPSEGVFFGDRAALHMPFSAAWARGEDTSVSDVDLLVVAEGLPEGRWVEA